MILFFHVIRHLSSEWEATRIEALHWISTLLNRHREGVIINLPSNSLVCLCDYIIYHGWNCCRIHWCSQHLHTFNVYLFPSVLDGLPFEKNYLVASIALILEQMVIQIIFSSKSIWLHLATLTIVALFQLILCTLVMFFFFFFQINAISYMFTLV